MGTLQNYECFERNDGLTVADPYDNVSLVRCGGVTVLAQRQAIFPPVSSASGLASGRLHPGCYPVFGKLHPAS